MYRLSVIWFCIVIIAKASKYLCVIICSVSDRITMQSTPLDAFHTQTHRPKCGDIMSSPPQLSPCCSATMDWWTSSRPSSPPPPPPLLHQAVLLLRCSAIAIYSCPPFSPCNTFIPQRYPLTLSSAFFTLNQDKNKKYMIWRTGLFWICLVLMF